MTSENSFVEKGQKLDIGQNEMAHTLYMQLQSNDDIIFITE